MAGGEALERGRDAFGRWRWREAYEQLQEADDASPLGPQDLGRYASAAFLLGLDAACVEIWTRCHREQLGTGDIAGAARCAFWLGFVHINRGEFAPAMGWFGRGQRLIDDAQLDCAERGYLLMPAAIQAAGGGDPASAHATFEQAVEIGERFGEPDLIAKARAGQGRCLVKMGRVAEGLALMDEAMVAATTGELSPIWVGDVYCTVIEGYFEAVDLRRAREWTAVLHKWCESQPDLVPFRGQCLVHRAELMQLSGSWPDAIAEADRACERLATHPMLGAAYYLLAELRRLRGELSEAEIAYRQANEHGRDPQPGLALLRLAQGRVDAARAAIGRVVENSHDRLARSRLLGAYVDILLAAGEVEGSRRAADELARIAADLDAPLLKAAALHARGAVLAAEGDAARASDALQSALEAWRDIDAPYEAARARVLLALALRELGDEDTASLELESALREFRQLGASLDVRRAEELSTARPKPAGGLTTRELEVITLVAEGKTNRAIAAELVLSEKTVARHVSNIFTKIGVSSRAAATAYAYENDLV